MSFLALTRLGFNEPLAHHFERLAPSGTQPARVLRRDATRLLVHDGASTHAARIPARLREDAPVAGDWIAISDEEPASTEALLPRRGILARKAAGRGTAPQLLATHVDVVLILAPLDRPSKPRGIERYVAAAEDGGVTPVVVLTKADRHASPEEVRSEFQALGVSIAVASALDGRGLETLRALLAEGVTLALVGPSGAGKSTLANALLGIEARATRPVRADGKGRHTTSATELVVTPAGILVDTPGLREIAPLGGIDEAFAEIRDLASRCRFRDCAHATEPGCAVRDNVEAARLEAWRKLARETARIEERERGRAGRAEARARDRAFGRFARATIAGKWRLRSDE